MPNTEGKKHASISDAMNRAYFNVIGKQSGGSDAVTTIFASGANFRMKESCKISASKPRSQKSSSALLVPPITPTSQQFCDIINQSGDMIYRQSPYYLGRQRRLNIGTTDSQYLQGNQHTDIHLNYHTSRLLFMTHLAVIRIT